MARILPILVLFSIASVSAQPPRIDRMPSLRDHVRKSGSDYEVERRIQYPELELATLVKEADLIIVGRVEGATPILIKEETDLATNCEVSVEQVLLNRRAFQVSSRDRVLVQRPGGVAEVEGHAIKIIDVDFPDFLPGQPYVLLLRVASDGSHFTLWAGGQSAFRIEKGTVRQMSRNYSHWSNSRGAVSIDALFAELQELTKVQQ